MSAGPRQSVCRGNCGDRTDDRHIMGRPTGPEFDAELPLSCESARELISAEADDALGGGEVDVLELHVDACSACTAYRADVVALARTMRVRAATFDPGFVDAVMQRTKPARLGRSVEMPVRGQADRGWRAETCCRLWASSRSGCSAGATIDPL